MKIKDFIFSHNRQNWHIEKVSFDALNLLVGGSGVGKTRILKALELICHVARGKNDRLDDFEWIINFSHLGQDYRWELKSFLEGNLINESNLFEIQSEKLVKYEDAEEIEIFSRTVSDSRFNNEKLLKLKRTESVINILSEEESIILVDEAFKRFIFNEIDQRRAIDFDHYKRLLLSNNPEFQKFKEISTQFTTLSKAYYLQNYLKAEFNEIKEYYKGIFPGVKDVQVSVDKSESHIVGLSYLFFEISVSRVC